MTTLNRVVAIARKLGITCGGDWVGSIDRPHFKIKSSWKMPKGYKLEGQVIVPSNSKLQVHLIVKDKKEEIKMTNWHPGHQLCKQKQKTISLRQLKKVLFKLHI
ncbi:hypothetical protein LAV73_06430 [Lysinibacillus xylanilyticus]|nr:hypothetical protein [Lysinibacillus xylanilyticus]